MSFRESMSLWCGYALIFIVVLRVFMIPASAIAGWATYGFWGALLSAVFAAFFSYLIVSAAFWTLYEPGSRRQALRRLHEARRAESGRRIRVRVLWALLQLRALEHEPGLSRRGKH